MMNFEECRVLVLKGDKEIRNYTKEVLEKIGFKGANIYLLNKAEVALKFLKSAPVIDLVLSEIGMAESVGPKLLAGLEEAGIRKRVIFLFYTGGGEAYARSVSEECGADGFIHLPATIDDIKKKIKQALKKHNCTL